MSVLAGVWRHIAAPGSTSQPAAEDLREPGGASSADDRPRLVALLVLWLISAAAYYLLLVRPYGLVAHLAIPRLSLGVLSNRAPRAAAGFLLCLGFTFLLYALAYRLSRSWRSERAAVACLVMSLLTAFLLVLVYPVGATDVFDYIVEGEMLALRDLNPMTVTPAAAPGIPFIGYAAYTHAISPYGPLWVSLQAALIKLASPGGLLALTLSFKALAVAGYLLACILIIAVLRYRAPQHIVAGLVAFAWNPLVLTEVAVNAHNDMWVAALVLAGVLFWEARRPLLSLVSLVLGMLVKAIAAPLLPLFALAAWRREPSGARFRLAIGGVIAIAALMAVPYFLLPEGLEGMTAMTRDTNLYTHSLPAVAYLALARRLPQHSAAVLVGAATTGLFGAYVLIQLWNAWRQPEEVVRLAFNTLLFLMLLCVPWFQPWYLLTPMALAAVYPRSNAPFQAALSTACVTVSYVIFGFVWFWWQPLHNNFLGINLLALLTTYAVPWAYAIWSGLRGRRASALQAAG